MAKGVQEQDMKHAYGYARVSSADQNEDRQLQAMYERGIPRTHIYVEKQSGKDFSRPVYRRMVKRLRKGDTLYILSIDRLGRNYREILEQWRYLTQVKKLKIVVMDMPLLDTEEHKELIANVISDLVLQLLSFVAENERENIRKRQEEGIRAARERGTHMGRPPGALPEIFGEIYDAWRRGEISGCEAARRCGMPASTFRYRANQIWEREKKQTDNS